MSVCCLVIQAKVLKDLHHISRRSRHSQPYLLSQGDSFRHRIIECELHYGEREGVRVAH